MRRLLPIAVTAAALLFLAGFGLYSLMVAPGEKSVADPAIRREPVAETLPGDLEKERISGRKQSSDKYSWPYGYDIDVKDQTIRIMVSLNFVPASQVSIPHLNQVKQTWKTRIESIWSNQYAVTLPSGRQFPILVTVNFSGPDFHHDIVVRPHKNSSDALNWNLTDTPVVAAHEFGHILGAYDEYKGGALSPETNMVDSTSIMTSNPQKGRAYARHYSDILDWFKAKTHNPAASLSEIRQKQPHNDVQKKRG